MWKQTICDAGKKKPIPSSAGQTGIKGRKRWKGIRNQLGKKKTKFKEGSKYCFVSGELRGERDTITLQSLRGDGILHAFKLAKYSKMFSLV